MAEVCKGEGGNGCGVGQSTVFASVTMGAIANLNKPHPLGDSRSTTTWDLDFSCTIKSSTARTMSYKCIYSELIHEDHHENYMNNTFKALSPVFGI